MPEENNHLEDLEADDTKVTLMKKMVWGGYVGFKGEPRL